MKKSIIAAGAASAVLAAMPVVGVFATTKPVVNVVDTLTFELAAGCTMTRSTGTESPENHPTTVTNSVAMGITAPGTYAEVDGVQVDIVCTGESGLNDTVKTWLLKAVGTGAAGHEADLKSGDNYISTSVTTDNLNGNGSGWAFKIANNTHADNTVNFVPTTTAYQVVPTSAGTIATMTYDDEATSHVGQYAFTPTYIVSVSDSQTAGTYEGGVKYTIVANPAS